MDNANTEGKIHMYEQDFEIYSLQFVNAMVELLSATMSSDLDSSLLILSF